MRDVRSFLLILLLSFFATHVEAAEARIIKVLPQFLDKKGMHTVAPSLFERDAYQMLLRDTPGLRSGLRFSVQHSSPGKNQPLKLRLELRSVEGQKLVNTTKETTVTKPGFFRTWSTVEITGKEYSAFGELTAWRATLWKGDKQVAEQKSFLW